MLEGSEIFDLLTVLVEKSSPIKMTGRGSDMGRLGAEAFAGAWAQGRAMTIDEAVDCALNET